MIGPGAKVKLDNIGPVGLCYKRRAPKECIWVKFPGNKRATCHFKYDLHRVGMRKYLPYLNENVERVKRMNSFMTEHKKNVLSGNGAGGWE